MKYKSNTVVEHNINILYQFVKEIYVVCSDFNYEMFKAIIKEKAKVLSIKSRIRLSDMEF